MCLRVIFIAWSAESSLIEPIRLGIKINCSEREVYGDRLKCDYASE